MRFLLSDRRVTIALLVAAVLVASSIGWRIQRTSAPEVPRPQLGPTAEREVQMDLFGAARSVEGNPKSAANWGEYGITLRAYRQHPEADECLRIAADLDPLDFRWPYLLGAHTALTDPNAAIVWFERAAKCKTTDDGRDRVRIRLAEALLAVGRVDDARVAIGREPSASPRNRLVAARIAIAAGDYRQAAEYLSEIDDQPLAARQVLLMRAEISRHLGRQSYAELLAKRAAEAPEGTWPDPLLDSIPARDYSRGGRLDEAVRLLRSGRPADAESLLRPLTFDKTDPRPFLGLAEVRATMGDRKGALDQLSLAIKVDPKNLTANYQFGLIHFQIGEQLWAEKRTDAAKKEFQESVSWLDKAFEVNPDFGKGILLKGAALHRFLGRQEEGLSLLRRFVQLRPEASEGHLLLGQALADSGQKVAALSSLSRAAELSFPGDHRAIEAIAKLNPDIANRRR